MISHAQNSHVNKTKQLIGSKTRIKRSTFRFWLREMMRNGRNARSVRRVFTKETWADAIKQCTTTKNTLEKDNLLKLGVSPCHSKYVNVQSLRGICSSHPSTETDDAMNSNAHINITQRCLRFVHGALSLLAGHPCSVYNLRNTRDERTGVPD